MTNKCTLVIRGVDVEFVFDNNSLMEFCDFAEIDISEFPNYVSSHQGTFMRTLCFAAAVTAAKYNGEKCLMIGEDDDGNPKRINEMDFGLLMDEFSESDYQKLVKAFQASRPDEKKKSKVKRRRIRS